MTVLIVYLILNKTETHLNAKIINFILCGVGITMKNLFSFIGLT